MQAFGTERKCHWTNHDGILLGSNNILANKVSSCLDLSQWNHQTWNDANLDALHYAERAHGRKDLLVLLFILLCVDSIHIYCTLRKGVLPGFRMGCKMDENCKLLDSNFCWNSFYNRCWRLSVQRERHLWHLFEFNPCWRERQCWYFTFCLNLSQYLDYFSNTDNLLLYRPGLDNSWGEYRGGLYVSNNICDDRKVW